MHRDQELGRRGRPSGHPILALLGALIVAAAGDAQPAPQAILLQPGAMIAPARQAAYVMAPDGGIVAVDIANGAVLWRSSEAAKPLALEGSRLVALSEAGEKLSVALLDVDRGGRLIRREPLPLPASAWDRIDDGLGRSLRTYAQTDGAGASILWESSHREIRGAPAVRVAALGAPPAPAPAPAAPENERGASLFDFVSGTLVAIGDDVLVPELPPRRPPILEGSERLDNVGDGATQFLSADRRHVLISTRIADDRTWDNRRWTIYERATGQRLGSISEHRSHADFMIWRSSIVYVSLPSLRRSGGDGWIDRPLQLRARRLSDGRKRWSLALRDTRYYGPFPP